MGNRWFRKQLLCCRDKDMPVNVFLKWELFPHFSYLIEKLIASLSYEKSYNHKMVQVGRDIKNYLIPTLGRDSFL